MPPEAPPATTAPAPASLLVNAEEAAALCGIGKTTWYALNTTGRCPRPVRLRGAVRWRREELEAWILAGCPARLQWEITHRRKENR
jgi:predicted DNA-binding transcriptional regulator AlpA